ncbi:Uncharacterized protein C24H6.02c [Tolypocladium ophioglossoides CBS 100239]|uniref:Uncharacterized protein C24H6.02c n=1 Tax=Tolypocladium ophioglossoides (strain CBS 100239) TaxID=1163406 RepID=A0A0L0NMG2_TOLOC|nr:Uncharacterized protein C24H6.02c [Tolypocladium ophioglossoides CBS 100239]
MASEAEPGKEVPGPPPFDSTLLPPLARSIPPRRLRPLPLLQTSVRLLSYPSPSPLPPTPRGFSSSSLRAAHSVPRPPSRRPVKPSPDAEAEARLSGDAPKSEGPRPETQNPAYYQLSFTCVPCGHRSHHNVSKQGYHAGSTLITCPSCRNRHVISDHLNIFGDRKITVEDLMREKGSLVKRGSLGEDGDIEFWPDEPSEPSERQADDSQRTGGS